MEKRLLRYILLLFIINCIVACSSTKQNTESKDEVKTPVDEAFEDRGDIRFVFYNVENLFDTKDDTLKADEEFLPWGMKAWKTERYEDKLKKIFKVLVNVGGWELPEMIGFCEIENRFVIEELLRKTPLSRGNYGIIHEDSPDARGIDLGFIYRKEAFLPLNHNIIRINFPFDEYKTRDILHVEGLINNKQDSIHVFLCHFPSRRGGQVASEPKREYVAAQLRRAVDSILVVQPQARIIITGDFNDEPTNNSIYKVLNAKENWENQNKGDLFNFMHAYQTKEGKGTYKYEGYWNMLDQFMVSESLRDSSNQVYLKKNSAQIYQQPWLMQEDPENPGDKPFRTYGGAFYYGGYSDHLPVYLDIFFRRP
ncbi:MAG: endonuclease [Bacteroidetes bacterium]|nr:endonuclease [Bacteroidota bacterium]